MSLRYWDPKYHHRRQGQAQTDDGKFGESVCDGLNLFLFHSNFVEKESIDCMNVVF